MAQQSALTRLSTGHRCTALLVGLKVTVPHIILRSIESEHQIIYLTCRSWMRGDLNYVYISRCATNVWIRLSALLSLNQPRANPSEFKHSIIAVADEFVYASHAASTFGISFFLPKWASSHHVTTQAPMKRLSVKTLVAALATKPSNLTNLNTEEILKAPSILVVNSDHISR